MSKDKYTAVWVSHSSIRDYLACPRAYFLKNVYRDPKTNHKVMLMQPSLALGQAVHDVIESLATIPLEERFAEPLEDKFERAWKHVMGARGGFQDDEEEVRYKKRGREMIERVNKHPGPLERKAIKIRQDLPYYWLSEEDNIILCGKIDWLEYLEEEKGVHIIDFKTGKFDEDPDSLQLPIYVLLAKNCQSWPVVKGSYWYLDRDDAPLAVELPVIEDASARVLDIAKKIHLARKLEHFKCRQKEGCRVCLPYEAIIAGRAHFVGVGGYNQDIYSMAATPKAL